MGFRVCSKGKPSSCRFSLENDSVCRIRVQDDHINVVKWHRIRIKGAITSNKIGNIIIATNSDLITRENLSS